MNDLHGRAISYLRLSVTDLCDLRCVYCMPEDGVQKHTHGEMCSLEELRDMTAAAVQLGVRKVRLTGGEPLARRGVVGLVRMVAAVPGIEEVVMTTNACLLAPVAGALREAGLSRLNVSLDTLRPDRYARITRCGRLEDALAGLDAARAAGFSHTKVNAVLMGGVNDDEVADLAGLARDEAVDVRFIELMPIGPSAAWPRGRFLPAEAVLEALPGMEFLGRDGVAELWHMPGWAGNVGLIRPMSHKFCDGCSRIRVTADGKLKPCLHSAQEIPLRGLRGEKLETALREGMFGKPVSHHMEQGRASESKRGMSRIGG